MKLLIKQRVFSWTDTYDIYDENGEAKYFVKSEFLSIGHKIHVYDRYDREVVMVREKLLKLLPTFEIDVDGETVGTVKKKWTFLRPKYEIDCNGWQCDGTIWGWDYDVISGGDLVAHISKELLHWGDTYVLDIVDPADEIMALMLVIAIDAANCSQGNN